MKIWKLYFGLLVCGAVPAVGGSIEEARRALADGLPEVALVKAKEAMTEEGSDEARLTLAEALLATEQPAGVLNVIDGLESPHAALLRGRAFQATGRPEEALRAFRTVRDGGTDGRLAEGAVLGEAQVLAATGRNADAVRLLEGALTGGGIAMRLMLAELHLDVRDLSSTRQVLEGAEPQAPHERKWKQYLGGRLLLSEGNGTAASAVFRTLVESPEGMTPRLSTGATMGLARLALEAGDADEAVDLLEDFMGNHVEIEGQADLFAVLDQAYAMQARPKDDRLEKWSEIGSSSRSRLATYHLARFRLRTGREEKAISVAGRFIETAPGHSLTAEAHLLIARAFLRDDRYAEALDALAAAGESASDAETLTRIELLAGSIHFRLREYEKAGRTFRAAAARNSPWKEEAFFNAALSWMNVPDVAAFIEDYGRLSVQFPESEFRRELILEEGLLQARAGDPAGGQTLRRFINDFPENSRVPEAQLALAEQAWSSPQRDGDAVSTLLRVASEAGDARTQARAAALKIFVKAEESEGTDELVRLATVFLREHGDSDLVPDVRMKLAEVYFHNGDFGNARTQFEIVAKEFPGSVYAESALYLAGMAAARSMNADRALELFEEVARKDGGLKLYARQEQAALKSRLGDDAQAIILYENVLAGGPDPELRHAALVGKGLSLMALGQKDSANYARAVEVFESVSQQPAVPPRWRNQAWFRKGKALQAMENNVGALTAFYDVLDRTLSEPGEPETFWFYKAGTEAARMLQQRHEWRGAVSIYEKMAQIEGPRREEILQRLQRLRLEHFIWTE